ncbi:MAG: PhoX family protein [Flavobacteriales bacterium]|nr:PhoX family protein [Flavobacteriales bacterium]
MRSRRDFIRSSGFIGIGFIGLKLYACGDKVASGDAAAALALDYGPLVKDPLGVLDLPEGFSYKVISTQGNPMDDGLLVPGKPDAMGTFEGEAGRIIIVRNHEIVPTDKNLGAFGMDNVNLGAIPKEDFYEFGKGDFPGLGGTTTLIFNEETQEVEKEFLSLAGTYRNCAGGLMPWGSWITCEEDVTKIGEFEGNVEKEHGYIFEVPATSQMTRVSPKPIKEAGRFNHEAVSLDPKTGILYMTEDRSDGLIYRFIPTKKNDLHSGGKLQALVIKNSPKFDTRNWPDSLGPDILQNIPMSLEWIELDDVEAPLDDLRLRGHEKGAALFARGEGMWYDEGVIYFACTNGGDLMKGQIFKLTPDDDGGKLELFIEPNNVDIMKYCDNLTVSPWGDVMLCEDDVDAYLRGVTPKGEIFTFGHSTKYETEFAGICFSPSGKTMFVNLQHVGQTLAITGPWKGQS